jgi:nicotinamide phosphoribosyltransferase
MNTGNYWTDMQKKQVCLPIFTMAGHDFSFRGMSSLESAMISGMGHLLSFSGTDTIPAIDALEKYYHADADKELIGGSVAATEPVLCAVAVKMESWKPIRRLITKVYPSGIV